ncbi:MAG: 3-hydroxyacyl-CoA dehydrogenase NAD-binding domain-containing protein [Thermomicrobiales bacterium]
MDTRYRCTTNGRSNDAREQSEVIFSGRSKKGVLAPLEFDAVLAQRVEPLDSLSDAVAGCSLVIEAIVEDLGAKQSLFPGLDALTASDVMLATNTSSMTITPNHFDSSRSGSYPRVALLQSRPRDAAGRDCGGAILALRSGATGRGEFVTSIGRVPVVLDKEIEGCNAPAASSAAIRREAFWLVENGCHPRAIDQAIELGCGTQWVVPSRRFQRSGRGVGDPAATLRAHRR